jgi:hypothetical protein
MDEGYQMAREMRNEQQDHSRKRYKMQSSPRAAIPRARGSKVLIDKLISDVDRLREPA